MNVNLFELFKGDRVTLADAAARLVEDDYDLKLAVAYLIRQIIRECRYDYENMELIFEENARFTMVGWDDIMAISKLWLREPYYDELTMIEDFGAREEELLKQREEDEK